MHGLLLRFPDLLQTPRLTALHTALSDPLARFEALVLHQFAQPLHSLIVRMQTESVVVAADMVDDLVGFVGTLRLYTDPNNYLAEGAVDNTAVLVVPTPSDDDKARFPSCRYLPRCTEVFEAYQSRRHSVNSQRCAGSLWSCHSTLCSPDGLRGSWAN